MRLFSGKKAERDVYIIVGCGRLGANLADAISAEGGNVVVIDREEDAFRKLSSSYGGLTLLGDATDPDTLTEAGIDRAKVLISVTDNDNVNIMTTQLAGEWFHVGQVIARLYDPERECIYQELDVDTICPAILSANEIRRLITPENEVRTA